MTRESSSLIHTAEVCLEKSEKGQFWPEKCWWVLMGIGYLLLAQEKK